MKFKLLNYPDGVREINTAGYSFDCGKFSELCHKHAKVLVLYTDSSEIVAYSPFVRLKQKTVSTLVGLEDSAGMTLNQRALALLQKYYATLTNLVIVNSKLADPLLEILFFLDCKFKLPFRACGLCVISGEHNQDYRRYFLHEVNLADAVLYADLV